MSYGMVASRLLLVSAQGQLDAIHQCEIPKLKESLDEHLSRAHAEVEQHRVGGRVQTVRSKSLQGKSEGHGMARSPDPPFSPCSPPWEAAPRTTDCPSLVAHVPWHTHTH